MGLGGLVIVLGVFILGIFFGYKHRPESDKVAHILHMDPELAQASDEVDMEPFWKVWNLLNEKSPEATSVSNQDRIYGAISGLVASFKDPYTVFFPPAETKSFQESIQGAFEGVGMEVGIKDDILTVIAPLKDTPAYKAGIKSGDKILKIDDVVTSDLSVDQAIDKIRGKKGTTVKLTIFRTGEQNSKEISIVRDTIAIPTLDTNKRDDGIFVISLYNFSANSAELFRTALKEFSNSGSDKLILDMRGNPGGFLDAAIDMASWFLPEGDVVVSEDFGTNEKKTDHFSKGYNVFSDKLKMVVLVDGGSASASEILAGALQDHKRATLIGEKTYGKGSVQELLPVTDDTALKVTIAKWLTPNGISISKQGLTPDIEVKLSESDIKNKNDAQMNKAVEFLLKK